MQFTISPFKKTRLSFILALAVAPLFIVNPLKLHPLGFHSLDLHSLDIHLLNLHSLNLPGALAAQAGAQTQPQPARKTSQPYKGDLSIFENKDRDQKLQVQRVMDILHIHPGANVADIGAGSGWFSVRAAKRAAPGGTVYAEDINPDSIAYINNRVHRENIPNVKAILGSEDDPKLPESTIDAVLIMKTYHEIARPVLLLQKLKKSLRDGARIGIIDQNGNGADHGIGRDVVIQEMSRAGYSLLEQHDFVKGDGQDYFLVFGPNTNHQ
jgi:SAM-dependent methyltransferase